MNTMRACLLPALLLLLLSACSMEQIDREWDAWVEDHNQCEVVEDCVLVYPGCPLGCYTAVNAEHEDEAARLADDLIARWSMGARDCAYDCTSAEVDCVEDVCEAIQTDEF